MTFRSASNSPASAPVRRPRRRTDAGQQAIVLVLAVLALMSALAVVIMTQTAQETPIVNRTLLDHAAYQAVRAGINDYLYAINANPNAAACSTSSPASCQGFLQAGFQFGKWNLVSRNVAANNLHQWFSFGSPTLRKGAPLPNPTPGTVDVTVVGAAGYLVNLSSIQYQTAHVIINPQNDLLLNVIWDNYTAPDPNIPGVGNSKQCRYEYQNGTDPCNSNGQGAVLDGSSFSVFGPLFSNDYVFVCNTPQIDYLTSGIPSTNYLGKDPTFGKSNYGAYAEPGCSNTVAWATPGGGTSKKVCQFCVDKGSPERAPTSDANLAGLAKLDGCYYAGPTTITFNRNGTYNVDSPETAATAATASNKTYDPFSSSLNKSQCFPSGSSNNGTVPKLPDNGVIYVGAPSASVCNALPKSTNPLFAAYRLSSKHQHSSATSSYDGETKTPQCEGDAIVHGEVKGDVTLGVNNDIIIDGNITYSSCAPASPNATTGAGMWKGSCTAQSGQINDVLGLVANNYVEIGLPTPTKYDRSPQAPGTCAFGITCQLKNPIIEAAILTLNQTFGVTNIGKNPPKAPTASKLGTIAFLGSLAEQYSDIEMVSFNTYSGTINIGYGMDYNWDQRLSVISPPSFLSPLGSSFWSEQSSSVTVGTCSLVWPVDASTCPAPNFPSS
jgi:hypothetical protein